MQKTLLDQDTDLKSKIERLKTNNTQPIKTASPKEKKKPETVNINQSTLSKVTFESKDSLKNQILSPPEGTDQNQLMKAACIKNPKIDSKTPIKKKTVLFDDIKRRLFKY